MLEKVKTALRIKSDAYNDEIADIIEAAKLDLSISGVDIIDDADPLIIRSIIMYAKANFGLDNPDAEKWNKAYVALKIHLALSSDYTTSEVVE